MTRRKRALIPTAAEQRILRALWQIRKGTIEEILNSFPEKERPNYKTTQAFLRIMEEKHFVRHTVVGRVFVFSPLISKDEVDRLSVQSLVQQNFGGSASDLLINLLESDAVRMADLDAIEQLIHDRRKRKAAEPTDE